MTVKLFEVRDRSTTLSMIGLDCDPGAAEIQREYQLLRHAGYGDRCILFGALYGGHFAHDPYDQPEGARTRRIAHGYISQHWDTLKSGDLVDVEFILGETPAPKTTDL